MDLHDKVISGIRLRKLLGISNVNTNSLIKKEELYYCSKYGSAEFDIMIKYNNIYYFLNNDKLYLALTTKDELFNWMMKVKLLVYYLDNNYFKLLLHSDQGSTDFRAFKTV